MPSTENNKFIQDTVRVGLTNTAYYFQVYDTPLGHRWLEALRDNLEKKRILEKNFCFLGFADSERNLNYLVAELNKSTAKINAFEFKPPYEKIPPFRGDDFQYSSNLPLDTGEVATKEGGLARKLKHEACNLLHRYFEDLQGTAWQLSEYYRQANAETKYAIRQLNNLCHEIENWVWADRKKAVNPEWIRPSQITTFLNAPRYDLQDEDYELFKHNRYDRELGGVYLHWSQIGKTLYEVWRDEDAPKLTEALCSEINHQKYYSGEFDIEWGRTITEKLYDFKEKQINEYRAWLEENGYDWGDPKLSLGYIKIGQVDLHRSFGKGAKFKEIYETMSNNLNITNIKIVSDNPSECGYPYTLDSDDWQQIQIDGLRRGYE